jgi:hypothetical protein
VGVSGLISRNIHRGCSSITSSTDFIAIPGITLTTASGIAVTFASMRITSHHLRANFNSQQKLSKISNSKRWHPDEANLVLFFQTLHAILQAMMRPLPSHKFPGYLPNIFWDFLQQGSITGEN